MSRITIIDTPKVTLWYHPEEKIVHHSVHGFIYGAEFKKLLLAISELFEKHSAAKWLSDDENHACLQEEDITWGEVNWFPQALAAGWKHMAIIIPKAVVARMNVDELVKKYSRAGINVKFFTNEADAWSWLVDQ